MTVTPAELRTFSLAELQRMLHRILSGERVPVRVEDVTAAILAFKKP